MNKIVCFFVFLSNIFVNTNVNGKQDQYVNKSYIVLNALNTEMIEGKDVHLIRSVASVSKIMTAILAIESGKLNEEILIAFEDVDTYGSSIYLKEGDKVKLLDLVYGLMLRSGNDAANAIARSVGGSMENFVSMMNSKAWEIGMKNSTFNNPSGLDVNEQGNLSTSYDLAILMAYAIKNKMFLEISSTKIYKSEIGTWSNKNKLLHSYKNTIAGKTGFTYKAKRTLVTAAKKDENIFVVVTLDCGNDFNFHKYLYEKNFTRYKSVQLLEKGENYIDNYLLTCDKAIYVTIPINNITEYGVVYKIDGDISKVYAGNNGDKKLIGECRAKEIDVEKKDISWLKKLFKIFRKKVLNI